MATKTARNKLKQQIFIAASVTFFLGSTVFQIGRLFREAITPPVEAAQTIEASPEVDAQGYEAVLQREPNNQTALQGLVKARLQLNDPKGAEAPLAKLIELNPDRQDYADLMQRVQQQISDSH